MNNNKSTYFNIIHVCVLSWTQLYVTYNIYIIALNKSTIKLGISNFKNTVNDNYYTSNSILPLIKDVLCLQFSGQSVLSMKYGAIANC